MRLSRWWKGLSFRWRVFVFLGVIITVTDFVCEFVFEPLVEGDFDLFDVDWYELPVWTGGMLAQGLVAAAIVTRMIMSRLSVLARATDQIAHGNLSTRVPVGGDRRDSFNRLAQHFNTMAETVECLLTNERRLLSDISHELRSPLSRISAAIELVTMHNTDAATTAHLMRIEKELAHMNHLVGVLLEQGRNRLSVREGRETVAMSELAEELAEVFRLEGATQKKALVAEIDPGLYVEGHPMQLHLIIENILGNALFYTPDDTQVDMSLRREDRFIRLEVRDCGPGVPENQLEDIFKPFYRVDVSRARKSGGIGLGLTLVKEACVALGGSVKAENSTPGLRITVLLPVSDFVPQN